MIFPIIKKIVQVVGGGDVINFPHPVTAAVKLSTLLTAVLAEPKVGAAVTRIAYTLQHLRGAVSAVNDGPDNWTNPGNATGSPDGSNATRSGQALGSSEANLRLTYDALTGKDDLTLAPAGAGSPGARLRFHVAQSGTALSNGGLHLEYRFGTSGAWTTLETITNNQNNLATPRLHNITSVVAGDWSNLANVQVRVRAILGTGTGGVTCTVDAVALEVNASRTDNL